MVNDTDVVTRSAALLSTVAVWAIVGERNLVMDASSFSAIADSLVETIQADINAVLSFVIQKTVFGMAGIVMNGQTVNVFQLTED